MSPPEVRLWLRLRAFGEDGPRFRRQHPMGPYVIDFYCPAASLAVEVDGHLHGMYGRPERDASRDAWLRAHGVEVYRVLASSVMADARHVADGVWRLAMARIEERTKG